MSRKKPEVIPLEDPTIIWFDPGGTSGWSVMSVHPLALIDQDVSILNNITHWSHGQFVGDENAQAAEMLGLIDAWPGCCVGHEDFILRTAISSREVLSPVRITAKVEFGLHLAGGVPYFRQMPSEAKNVATDERLRAWGFYQREGGLEHARDADRHSLTWLRKCKQHRFMREQCWPYLFGPDGEFYQKAEPSSEEEEELG